MCVWKVAVDQLAATSGQWVAHKMLYVHSHRKMLLFDIIAQQEQNNPQCPD